MSPQIPFKFQGLPCHSKEVEGAQNALSLWLKAEICWCDSCHQHNSSSLKLDPWKPSHSSSDLLKTGLDKGFFAIPCSAVLHEQCPDLKTTGWKTPHPTNWQANRQTVYFEKWTETSCFFTGSSSTGNPHHFQCLGICLSPVNHGWNGMTFDS